MMHALLVLRTSVLQKGIIIVGQHKVGEFTKFGKYVGPPDHV